MIVTTPGRGSRPGRRAQLATLGALCLASCATEDAGLRIPPPSATPPPMTCEDADLATAELSAESPRATLHGLTVVLEGTGHDSFEGGGFDFHATMRFERDSEIDTRMISLVSEEAQRPIMVLGRCVFVRPAAGGVSVGVAPRGEAARPR